MKNTTITLYVPQDKIEDFHTLLQGADVEVPIYSESMYTPRCYQVNVSLFDFQFIKHLIRN